MPALQGSASFDPQTDSALGWDVSTGWVQLKVRNSLQENHAVPLCWLPEKRRGDAFAAHDRTVVIGAKTGAITILDFTSMLANVHGIVTS
jgi:hypothetical protein